MENRKYEAWVKMTGTALWIIHHFNDEKAALEFAEANKELGTIEVYSGVEKMISGARCLTKKKKIR